MPVRMHGDAELILRLAAYLEGLTHALEAVSGPGPLIAGARELVEEARATPRARMPVDAPASDREEAIVDAHHDLAYRRGKEAGAKGCDELRRLALEYFSADSLPHRVLAGYDIQDMLGVGDPRERAAKRKALAEERAAVDEMRQRHRERTGS